MAMAWRLLLLGLRLSVASPAVSARADEEIRPHWMRVGADKQVVQLLLVGAEDGSNGTMNFNGYGNGSMTVTVPLGWKVEVEFRNKGLGALPHSLAAIGEVTPLPVEGNVWEWVRDWYGEYCYAESPHANPPGPEQGESRVLRGVPRRGRGAACAGANEPDPGTRSASSLPHRREARRSVFARVARAPRRCRSIDTAEPRSVT